MRGIDKLAKVGGKGPIVPGGWAKMGGNYSEGGIPLFWPSGGGNNKGASSVTTSWPVI